MSTERTCNIIVDVELVVSQGFAEIGGGGEPRSLQNKQEGSDIKDIPWYIFFGAIKYYSLGLVIIKKKMYIFLRYQIVFLGCGT